MIAFNLYLCILLNWVEIDGTFNGIGPVYVPFVVLSRSKRRNTVCRIIGWISAVVWESIVFLLHLSILSFRNTKFFIAPITNMGTLF